MKPWQYSIIISSKNKMELIKRFKKDYLNYLVSTIIPVLINAVSIPLFKQLLGAEGYGRFSITFNAVLLCTAILSGWVWQSIIRFFNVSSNKQSFARQSLLLSAITQLIFVIPVVAIVWLISNDLILALFFALTLFITSMQFSLVAISQSVFLSKKSIYFEFIRAISYISCALLLLKFSTVNYLYALFTATLFSYGLSFYYLLKQSNKKLLLLSTEGSTTESRNDLFKRFLTYGWPLSLWFVFSFLISVVDKYFMLKTVNAEAQGNYQALFDVLFKSITLIITPVIVTLFPLLTAAYQKGETNEIRKLLKTILGFEFAGLIVTMVLYWLFGADILFNLIKIPDTFEYKLMGLFVIAGTFFWQMAIVIQKQYELKFKNKLLLVMVIISFSIQPLLYILVNNSNKQLIIYPIGFMISSSLYLFFVSFSLLKNYFFQILKRQTN